MSHPIKGVGSATVPTGFGRAATTIAVGQSGYALIQHARQWWKNHVHYNVTISATDDLYPDVQTWLVSMLPPTVNHAIRAQSENASRSRAKFLDGMDIDSPQEKKISPKLRLSYDDNREQTVMVGSHNVRVEVRRAEGVDAPVEGRSRTVPDQIIFTARNAEGQKAVLDLLQRLLNERHMVKRDPRLYMLSSWGDWAQRDDLPARSMESVILTDGQSERLVGDLAEFLASESEYVRRSIPWHRGYLLSGPPGTGKTSIAKGLANHFGLDVWYASLSDISKDANLLSLISQVRPRSLLLLEDVDSLHAATERNDEANQITMSGLLNALDGVATPHGLITVMTTNHVEVLDEAITRPGRVDRLEHIGLPDSDQATRYFKFFYGTEPSNPIDPQGRSMSALTEVCKRHMSDSTAAEAALLGVPDITHTPAEDRESRL